MHFHQKGQSLFKLNYDPLKNWGYIGLDTVFSVIAHYMEHANRYVAKLY